MHLFFNFINNSIIDKIILIIFKKYNLIDKKLKERKKFYHNLPTTFMTFYNVNFILP